MPRMLAWTLAISALLACATSAQAADDIQFNRDIRPILAANCLSCHGPDSASRKGDLRLDRRDDAIAATAVVPGQPDESELIRRILLAADDKELMPPTASHKKLTADQKKLLERWIASGAEYQPHWSFIPPVRAELPTVKNEAWIRNPIDRFVLARLETMGLEPAPEVDRRTLARRASLDLTGLPPDPADVATFVNDSAPDAYEKYLDKLLASPQWGEHRGRYWLDAARYADTHGIHFDNFREMWTYRDWVIDAFNRNLPFDQFTIEQLAGDLLPNRTLQQQIASGFNRCNITTNEGGVIGEEYLVLYTRDRTETTSRVFMGLTTGCAVCHDHKFDPITQKEFYELAAFFNNSTQGAMDGNIKDTPPIVVVTRTEDQPRWDALVAEVPAAKKQADERKKTAEADFATWLATADVQKFPELIPPGNDLHLHADLNTEETRLLFTLDGQPQEIAFPTEIAREPGAIGPLAFKSPADLQTEIATAGDFERDQPFTVSTWIKLSPGQEAGAIVARMDTEHDYRGWDLWLEGGKLGTHIISKWEDDALKVVSKNKLKANVWTHVAMTYDGQSKAGGVKLYVDGVAQDVQVQKNSLKNSIRTSVALKLGQREKAHRINDLALQDLRIYKHVLSPAEVAQAGTAARLAWLISKHEKLAGAERNELLQWWLPKYDQTYQDLAAKAKQLEEEQAAIKARGTIAHVMQERGEAPKAYILFRGEYDKRRDEVKASTPSMLPPLPEGAALNRLGFAQWLLRPEHPLTARVTVNRFWQEVFGTGLVRTAEDFGASGELPSHPELLDWMALEFREQGWDVKKFFKLMLLSATYRQQALTTPQKLELDPHNRQLSRGPRFRLDAELIRDYALASSGLLTKKIGGPSVRPYQPDGVWEAVAMPGSNTRNYKADTGENLYRRSMYTFWKRAAPPASMEIFNAPSREVCTVRRERTNTPLQALVTLNDPQLVEAARSLAQKALKEGGSTTETQLDLVANRLLSRSLKENEATVVKEVLNDLLAHYAQHADDAAKLIATGESKPDGELDASKLAAWTMVVNLLLNLDEALNK